MAEREKGLAAIDRRIATVVARRWAKDGYNAEIDANALVLELTAEVDAIARERADAVSRAVLDLADQHAGCCGAVHVDRLRAAVAEALGSR